MLPSLPRILEDEFTISLLVPPRNWDFLGGLLLALNAIYDHLDWDLTSLLPCQHLALGELASYCQKLSIPIEISILVNS